MRRAGLLGLVPGLLLGAISLEAAAYPRPGLTEIVSVTSAGEPANGPSGSSDDCLGASDTLSISGDGRFIAFASTATNLAPGDINLVSDIFRHDRKTGRTELVSMSSLGVPAAPIDVPVDDLCLPGSYHPSISRDGRYVAFMSWVNLLVDDDIDALPDVFVHDMKTARTELVSVTTDGDNVPDRTIGGGVAISGDGRFVAFEGPSALDPKQCETSPGPLAGDVCPLGRYVLMHDRQGNTTEVATKDSQGEIAEGYGPSLSHDGRVLAFGSQDDQLPTSTPNANPPNQHEAYVRDLEREQTIHVSRSGDPGSVNAGTHTNNTISGDGRYILFEGPRTGHVPNDAGPSGLSSSSDVFVFDRQTERTERVSVTSDGRQTLTGSSSNAISPNGRYIVWHSFPQETNCPAPCEESWMSVHDLWTGATEAIPEVSSLSTDQATGGHALSSDGRFIAFHTAATGADDRYQGFDVFVHDRGRPVFASGSLRSSTTPGRSNEPAWLRGTDPLERTLPALDLIEARVVHRPHLEDLYVRLDVEQMVRAVALIPQPFHYGVSFESDGKVYEIRIRRTPTGALDPGGADFVLFRCEPPTSCTALAELAGGYGTVGHAVVVSLPTRLIGLEGGGVLRDVRAFTAPAHVAGPAAVTVDAISLGTIEVR